MAINPALALPKLRPTEVLWAADFAIERNAVGQIVVNIAKCRSANDCECVASRGTTFPT